MSATYLFPLFLTAIVIQAHSSRYRLMNKFFAYVCVCLLCFLGCGGDSGSGGKSPRELCTETEQTLNSRAMECNPDFVGRIELSCNNFGTGDSCDTIDNYFDCLADTACEDGSFMQGTGCTLGACTD